VKHLHLAVLVCAFLLGTTRSEGLSGSYSASIEGAYDSNLPQNMTGYAGLYAAPQAWLKLYLWKPERAPWVALGTRLTYENYIEQRSPLLNDPLAAVWVEVGGTPGDWRWTIAPGAWSYASPVWDLVWMRYRGDAFISRKTKRHDLSFGGDVVWNDYGDSLENSLEWDLSAGYEYNRKVRKKDRFAVKSLGMEIGFERRSAATDTGSFSSLHTKWYEENKIFFATVTLFADFKVKRYDGYDPDEFTGLPVRRLNRYLYAGGDLEMPIGRNLDLDVGGQHLIKRSTLEAYSYNRYKIWVKLRWAGKFGAP